MRRFKIRGGDYSPIGRRGGLILGLRGTDKAPSAQRSNTSPKASTTTTNTKIPSYDLLCPWTLRARNVLYLHLNPEPKLQSPKPKPLTIQI